MCGALATSAPVRSNTAQEKSSRSLMFTEIGGVLQGHAHLLGDRHEEVVEYFQHDRIGPGAECGLTLFDFDTPQQDMVLGGDFRLPARFDDDGLMRFDDQRRACQPVPGA